MADLQVAMLLSMGYPKEYIDRALEVHKKSKYGTNWNISILIKIIVRLQEKDQQQTQLFQHRSRDNDHHNDPSPHNRNNVCAFFQLQQSRSTGGLSSDDSGEAKEDAFTPYYVQMDEPLGLKVNDYVDYRYENGRYLLCKIIAKSVELNHMMLLHPVGKPIYDTKYDRLVDIYHEYFKLSAAKSVSLRKIKSSSHTLYHLGVGDDIDINPFCNGHRGWKNGKIIKLDPHSAQVKVLYHNETDNKNYSFWFHLLNITEIAGFATKCKKIDTHPLDFEHTNTKTLRHKDDFKQNINGGFAITNTTNSDHEHAMLYFFLNWV